MKGILENLKLYSLFLTLELCQLDQVRDIYNKKTLKHLKLSMVYKNNL